MQDLEDRHTAQPIQPQTFRPAHRVDVGPVPHRGRVGHGQVVDVQRLVISLVAVGDLRPIRRGEHRLEHALVDPIDDQGRQDRRQRVARDEQRHDQPRRPTATTAMAPTESTNHLRGQPRTGRYPASAPQADARLPRAAWHPAWQSRNIQSRPTRRLPMSCRRARWPVHNADRRGLVQRRARADRSAQTRCHHRFRDAPQILDPPR